MLRAPPRSAKAKDPGFCQRLRSSGQRLFASSRTAEAQSAYARVTRAACGVVVRSQLQLTATRVSNEPAPFGPVAEWSRTSYRPAQLCANAAKLQLCAQSVRVSRLGTRLAETASVEREDRVMMLNSTQMVVLLGLLVLVAVGVVALLMARSRRRHAELKRRFGPEYEREVEQLGSVTKAEHELAAREKRVRQQQLRRLPEAERVRFASDWRNVEARFVDDPSGAVTRADELIKAVMLARGYEIEYFERRVAATSVEHANVVQHYRAARGLADANREGRANTEDLRQAVVHYRALFADLLEQPQLADRQLQEARV